ncbi:hypothetical protein MUP32_05390, partial [Candidatus Microgenomates bacterium]|nr:hypothetical protein [Candidatus Microgenomates bacterium]
NTNPSNFSLQTAGGHSPVNPLQGDIYTNDSSPLMEWADSADTNFDHYEYVVYTTDVDSQTERDMPVCPIWGCGYNGANLNPPTSPLTSSFYQAGNTGDGIYFWRVYAFDKAGNRTLSNAASGNNYTWKVVIDTQPPSTTISTPSSDISFTTDPITISGQSTDNRAINTVSLSYTTFNGTSCDSTYLPIDVLVNPDVSSSYSWSHNWTPSISGKYCVKASATDHAGNSEQSPVVENIFYHVLSQLQLTSTDDKHTISFDISDVSSFVSLDYKLTYLADGKDEGLEGVIAINGSIQIVRDLSTGSCSTDGCSFPTEIKEIKLQIILTDDMGYKSQLEESL